MTRDPRATNLVPRIWTVSGSHRFPLARFRSRRRTHAVSNVRPWPSLFDSPPRSLPLSHGVEKEGTTWRRCVSVWTPRHRCVSRSKATKHRGPHEKIPRRTERENTGSLLNAPSEFLNRAAFSLSLSRESSALGVLSRSRGRVAFPRNFECRDLGGGKFKANGGTNLDNRDAVAAAQSRYRREEEHGPAFRLRF